MRWHWNVGWKIGGVVASMAVGSCDAEVDEIRDEAIDRWIELYCESRSACECGEAQETDVCGEAQDTTWEARRRAAGSRGLVYDADCVDSDIEAIEAAMCEWPEEGSGHACHSYCALFHGEREAGASCEAYDERTSDCAQGLLCNAGTCVDPCNVLTGLAAGETCRGPNGEDLDRCADGLVCNDATLRCTVAADLGEPCANEGDCTTGLYCNFQSEVWTCVPERAVGESCDFGEPCQEGLYCQYDEFGGPSVCAPNSQEGQPCEGGQECADGLHCDWSTNFCRGPGSAGASCSQDDHCAEELSCDNFNSVCFVPPAVGQPCPSLVCAEGSWCDAMTDPAFPVCAVVAPDGQPCTGHSRCESGYCPAGYCLPRPLVGEDCTELFVCAEGLSCDGATCKPSHTKGPAVCVYEGW